MDVLLLNRRVGRMEDKQALFSFRKRCMTQPARSLLVLDHYRRRYKTRERELLDPSVFGLQRRHFRRVEIAFRIHGQVVQRTELSRSGAPRSKSIQELKRLAVEDHDLRLASIRHVEIALPGVW